MRLPCRGEYASAGSALLPRAGASDQEPQRPRRDGMLSKIEHHPKKRGSGRSAGGSQWEKDDLSMVEDWLPCNRENSNDTLLAGDFRPKGLHHHRRQTRNEKKTETGNQQGKPDSVRPVGGNQLEGDALSMVEDWSPCNRENRNETTGRRPPSRRTAES